MKSPRIGAQARVVLVTGGGSGIGHGIARRFAADGCRVIIAGRRLDAISAVADEIGGSCCHLDLRSVDSIQRLADTVAADFGRVDVIVNNAGVGRPIDPAIDLNEAARIWDDVLGTNLRGTYLLIHGCASLLPRPGGRIVNIGSIVGWTGGRNAGSVAYAASKSGLIGLTAATARALAGTGITVNTIAIGYVDGTQISDAWSSDIKQQIASETLNGSMGTVSDIADIVAFIASPAAAFVNGSVVHANGGMRPA